MKDLTTATANYQALWINPEEAGLLLYLLGKYDKAHPLYARVQMVQALQADKVHQLAELVAREKANGFWSETENVLKEIRKKMDKEKRKRHRKVEERISCLPPEQMKALLNGDLVVDANGELKPPSTNGTGAAHQGGGEVTGEGETGEQSEGCPFSQPQLHVVQKPDETLPAHPQQPSSPAAPVASDEREQLKVPKRDRRLRGGLGS